LSKLAENLSLHAIDIGSVFLMRGIGAILGAMLSAKLYVLPKGNVMGMGFLLVVLTFLLLSYNASYYALHLHFLLVGVATGVTDTGYQIMTSTIHRKCAGPWLAANTAAFGLAGAIADPGGPVAGHCRITQRSGLHHPGEAGGCV